MKNGILIIDKEKGMTSRDVVNQICKKFSTKKVGHTGTLDPLATGVLVVAINEGCKIIEFLESDEKEYIAKVLIGVSSETLDVEGELKFVDSKHYTKEEINEALHFFKGVYEQEVPKFSAVHVNGKRLYEYARSNEEVELPKREVDIKEIELLEIYDNNEYQEFTFKVLVSKGTYIRSLIRDIGLKLGSPCIMKELRRIRQGVFKIEDSKKLKDVCDLDVVSLSVAMSNYDSLIIKDIDMLRKIKNGCKLNNCIKNFTCFIDEEGNLLAIYEPSGNLMLARKVFVERNN